MKLSPQPSAGMRRKPATHKIPLDAKTFIAWDGEGVNLKGPGKPQSYVLFGSSAGHISNRGGLSAFECLDHIIDTGVENPGAVHVGFAFGYDSNMIIRSLSPSTLGRLHKNGWVRLRRKDGRVYAVTFAKGKFFRVTLYRPEYHTKQNPHAKVTVQIFDMFSFFATSFIKAYEQMVGPVPAVIREGKAARGEFRIEDFDEILEYWSLEIQMMKELATEFRRRVYNAGLRITQWHGPGALASYAMQQHKIKEYMNDCGPDVRMAARYAYAGGRFECLNWAGYWSRIRYDINSAYPRHCATPHSKMAHGTLRKIYTNVKFGVYRVRLKKGGGFMTAHPGFLRQRSQNITFRGLPMVALVSRGATHRVWR